MSSFDAAPRPSPVRVTAFSDWTAGNDSGPLTVSLNSFTAQAPAVDVGRASNR